MDQQTPIGSGKSKPLPSFAYKWTLENFEVYKSPLYWQRYIESPKFQSGLPGDRDEQWKLTLRTQGRGDHTWSIKASFSGDCKYFRWVSQFSLLNSKNQQSEHIRTYNDQMLPFFSGHILNDKGRNLLSDNSLTIYCEIFTNTDRQLIVNGHCGGIQIPQCRLMNDLEHLLKSEEFSDVTLCSDGERDFKAHKAILASRSPVFKAMFSYDLLENNENRVRITDISAETLSATLKFIYSDQSPIEELEEKGTNREDIQCLALELLQAADKYQLDRLKSICENFLFKSITLDSVAEIVSFADLYNLSQLKEFACKYKLAHDKRII